MSSAGLSKYGPVPGDYSPEEWEARCDLAACYRLVDHYGWSDLFGTHISLRCVCSAAAWQGAWHSRPDI